MLMTKSALIIFISSIQVERENVSLSRYIFFSHEYVMSNEIKVDKGSAEKTSLTFLINIEIEGEEFSLLLIFIFEQILEKRILLTNDFFNLISQKK